MMHASWSVRILRAHKTHCSPDWHWVNPRGQWEGFLFWLILKGAGELRTERQPFALGSGHCLIMRMWERIEGVHDPRDPLLVPWLHYEYVDEDGQAFRPEPLPREFRRISNTSFVSDMLDRAIESFYREEHAAANHWLKAGLLEVAQQEREPHHTGLALDQAQRIERLCVAVRENPEMEWRVDDMARQMHCTADHFTRFFRRIKGCTPSAFVIRTRIEHAKGLLRFSGHPVGRIADMLGYADVFYFSRQFKERTGMSPSAYRRPRRR